MATASLPCFESSAWNRVEPPLPYQPWPPTTAASFGFHRLLLSSLQPRLPPRCGALQGAGRWGSQGGLSGGWPCHWSRGQGEGLWCPCWCVGPHKHSGGGAAFQVACVSWNRKGWFCCKRHLSWRQAPGRLTGCLCQGLSHKQRHEGGLSKAGRLAASRATGAAAAPLCAAPPSAGPRAPHCVGRGAEPGFISCSRSASCMPGLNPHGLGQSKTPVLMERTSGGHRLRRSVTQRVGQRYRRTSEGERGREAEA